MKLKDKEYEKRKEFLQVYSDFNIWLQKLGFESDKTFKSTHLDFHYSFYNEKIDDLCSVEHYINKRLKFSIRFLRGRNEHHFMIVGDLGSSSELLRIEDFKELVIDEVVKLRNEKLEEMNFFNWL